MQVECKSKTCTGLHQLAFMFGQNFTLTENILKIDSGPKISVKGGFSRGSHGLPFVSNFANCIY